MDYRLLISIEVLEFVERLPGRTRRGIRAAFSRILENPLGASDATDIDETGRFMQLMIVGDFALTYWIDDTDRHIKILDIHATDG